MSFEYEITKIQDRIIEGKLYCVMFVSVDCSEILSTSFSIEFELVSDKLPQKFIEQKILEKIEYIKRVEGLKKAKKTQLENLKAKFEKAKGKIT